MEMKGNPLFGRVKKCSEMREMKKEAGRVKRKFRGAVWVRFRHVEKNVGEAKRGICGRREGWRAEAWVVRLKKKRPATNRWRKETQTQRELYGICTCLSTTK